MKNQVICVSIPRSGHHLIVELLTSYFDDFKYCEYYVPEDCCKNIPCTKPKMNLQKNHDFDLSLPVNRDWHYVIQYRNPLLSAMSDFELFLSRRDVDNPKLVWYSYAVQRRNFWRSFIRKWGSKVNLRNVIVVPYEEVVDVPHRALRRLVSFFSGDDVIDSEMIDRVIRHRKVKATRSIEDFQVFNLPFLLFLEWSLRQEMDVAGVRPRLDDRRNDVQSFLMESPSEEILRLMFFVFLERQPRKESIQSMLRDNETVGALAHTILGSKEYKETRQEARTYNQKPIEVPSELFEYLGVCAESSPVLLREPSLQVRI
ncbi:MAG: hypothetical protein OEQ39_15635 [Gammaproteobacteria bacterium]|nr:hypothetical protein [Gammaproteobacteria bacterium]MDH3465438.1 hypothetical protein [Gammaproteobacteria bacterium]